ncbi:Muscle M-line assembly protein unc-89 [Frankliniella fusca]|uniref:Muscle M-line assembly protein unc-89 n=1 Tax=Frankliniella fusca TaxID=407009 RepID=A0AAE1HYE6_9NEOP|nr:Muscle M-line assembly protein unc-89 [Frankliniella fusca]
MLNIGKAASVIPKGAGVVEQLQLCAAEASGLAGTAVYEDTVQLPEKSYPYTRHIVDVPPRAGLPATSRCCRRCKRSRASHVPVFFGGVVRAFPGPTVAVRQVDREFSRFLDASDRDFRDLQEILQAALCA